MDNGESAINSAKTPDTAPPFVSRATDGSWHILVHALPGAKKSEFSGIREGRLCIRIAAPALENRANAALADLTAKALNIRPAKISVISGVRSRQKRLRLATDSEPDWSLLLP
ncbi:MAG: DUF167 domain-containing protein [Desulfovibrio sp.]|jgi:uncharacterized protein YggU (UPF0235/DUF167 family)|nr:DUF167 domain-containing protein [Desulfovibrio sp.]